MDIGEIRNRVMQMESEDVRNELAALCDECAKTRVTLAMLIGWLQRELGEHNVKTLFDQLGQ